MMKIGLTGSIGMGKSTTAAMLRRLGLLLFDADAEVHRLLAPGGGAVAAVRELFPGAGDGRSGIDRAAVGRRVFADPAALKRLEAVLHPRVAATRRRFLAAAARRRAPLVILDIPLLFEGGGERQCDAVILVTAPAFLQRQRVLRRPGMTEARFRGILAHQIPDAEKRRRARFIVQTGIGRRPVLRRLLAILAELAGRDLPRT
jgi:dephospho-CoA kinase